MQDAHESNEDRLARRRARRWNRRARIFAPFLAVPGMLCVLMLSVNLIEHRPDAGRKATPSNRPSVEHAAERRADHARTAPIAQAAPTAAVEPVAGDAGVEGHALSPDAVIANAVGADMPLAPGIGGAGEQAALFGAPTPTMDGAGER